MKRSKPSCTTNRRNSILPIVIALLIVACLLSLCIGASSLKATDALAILLGRSADEKAGRILLYVRLPRLLAALLAGSALSLSGLLLQEVLMNSLAAPSVIGVNAGAGFFTLCTLAFFPAQARFVPVAAFLGAMCAALFAYGLARLTGTSKSTIVLAGVAVSGLFGACMDAVVSFVPDAVGNRSSFAIGAFSSVTLRQLAFALPIIVIGVLPAWICRRERTVMQLGDEVASSLGLPVERYRLLFLTCAALLAGGAVSFSGLLGFVGLMTPHIARAILRKQKEGLTALTMLLGALLCVISDLAARTLFKPYELPVGVLLSFLGAPFFLALLIRGRREMS